MKRIDYALRKRTRIKRKRLIRPGQIKRRRNSSKEKTLARKLSKTRLQLKLQADLERC
jgi:hypothetical protein